jgi:hypothetical protein
VSRLSSVSREVAHLGELFLVSGTASYSFLSIAWRCSTDCLTPRSNMANRSRANRLSAGSPVRTRRAYREALSCIERCYDLTTPRRCSFRPHCRPHCCLLPLLPTSPVALSSTPSSGGDRPCTNAPLLRAPVQGGRRLRHTMQEVRAQAKEGRRPEATRVASAPCWLLMVVLDAGSTFVWSSCHCEHAERYRIEVTRSHRTASDTGNATHHSNRTRQPAMRLQQAPERRGRQTSSLF